MAQKQPNIFVIDEGTSLNRETPAAIDLDHQQSHSKDQKPKTTRTKITERTYNAFHVLYGDKFSMTRNQYRGLCAYLRSILEAGFAMKEREIDDFITMYSTYDDKILKTIVVNLEDDNTQDNTQEVGQGYHEWFQDNRLEEEPEDRLHVLNANNLRGVWEENKFDFLVGYRSLIYMYDLSRRRNDLR